MKRLLFACSAAIVLIAQPARAIEINFGTVLTDIDDQPIKDGEKVLTLGRAAAVALMLQSPEDSALPGDEKAKRGHLATLVYPAKPMDLSVDDIALIKKLIGRAYGPIVVTRAYPLLDQKK